MHLMGRVASLNVVAYALDTRISRCANSVRKAGPTGAGLHR